MMHWVKDHQTETFLLSLILCCSLGHALAVTIRLEDVSDLLIIEGEMVNTRRACRDSSIPSSSAVVFSLTVFPVTSDITFLSDSFIIPANTACEAIQINSVGNSIKEDTKTFRLSLTSTADVQVDENQDHFILHVLDDDTGTSDSCPSPTAPINGVTVSCPSHTAGSECTYQCNSGYEIVDGSFSRTCNYFILRWSETPLYCDQVLGAPPTVVDCPVSDIIEIAPFGSNSVTVTWQEPSATSDTGGMITVIQTHFPGSRFLIGVTEVTYTFTDNPSGQTEMCTFLVVVQRDVDTTPPDVNCPPDVVMTIDLALAGMEVVYEEPSATDNSGIVFILSQTHVPGEFFPEGLTPVTYIFADASGNTAECRFDVILEITRGTGVNTPPVIICPDPVAVTSLANNVDANVSPVITCPDPIAVTSLANNVGNVAPWNTPTCVDAEDGGVTSAAQLVCIPASGSFFPGIGVNTVTCTCTDSAGALDQCSFSVTISGFNTPPVITCPAPVVVTSLANNVGNSATWDPPTCVDAEDGTITTSVCVPASGFFFTGVGVNMATCTCTDSVGLSVECVFQVTVQGVNTPPVIICPDPVAVTSLANNVGNVASWVAPTCVDAEDGGVTPAAQLVCIPASGSFFPGIGVNTVTCICTDSAGASDQCSFPVTISGFNTLPVITCPAPVVVTSLANNVGNSATWDPPTCVDAEDGTITTSVCVPASGLFFTGVGVNMVTCTCTDSVGLSVECVFEVTVQDANVSPVITCPDPVAVTSLPNNVGNVASWDTPACVDAEDGGVTSAAQLVCIPASGSFFPGIGVNTVTCTCTDSAGASEQCSFPVTISDDVTPTIINCPTSPIVVYIPIGQMQGEATWTEPIVTGVSGEVTVSRTHSPGENFQVGTTGVTYNFYDAFNNMESCAFNVTVTTVGIVCPPSITISYGDQLSYTTPQCTSTSALLNAPSSCIPRNGIIAEEDVLGVCSCRIAPHITCTFQVTVATSVQCPSSKTISPGDTLSYEIPQCTSGQGSHSASCLPSTGSSVITDTSVTCSCPQDGSIQCSFQIFVDCTALYSNFCGNPGVSCDCMDESCDPDTGICSRSCTIVNTCPASIESESLSQVNPSSPVDITCTLRGSTAILQGLQLRLSSKLDSLDETGITRLTGNGVNTGNKVQSTFRVNNETKEKTLYCVLLQTDYLIGGVSVSGFLHELPSLNAAPIHEGVSNTTVTISWRAWDPNMDDGDPPIVAYIPYYRMDASDEWISSPRILSNETLQFEADNLEVDTLYEFSVAVVREGENGEGRRSPSVIVKTLCNVPNLAVSVNVQLTSSNRVNVSWQLPPGEIMCSTGVTSYKVYYRIEGSIDDTPRLAGTVGDADTRWFIIDDGLLQPGSSYIFFVTVTTDQESGFRESIKPIQAPADTSVPVYLIIVVVIPVLLIAVIVIFLIVRCHRKNNLKKQKTTNADTDYANADDHEDYISLEEQSRTVPSSKYEDLNQKPQGGASIPPQYEVTIVAEPQKPVATPRYQTRNMKGVINVTYEDLGVSSENRQLPDVPRSHPSGYKGEDASFDIPDRLERYTGVSNNIRAKPVQPGSIKVAGFQKFMRRNKEDVVRDIFHQFMALPSGGQYSWSVALKFQNKPRNLFKTIFAYDHSRVKLATNGSDARSDYINASYIQNQQGKTFFIAAQGPQEGTVDDFWKMVWQENVETIVMVTDTMEKNKNLCCTYWPSKVHAGEVYGDITVILMESISYTSHTTRKLNLLKGNHKAEVHTVTQVQVHSWPYGGVPKEPASLISIIKKVKTLQTVGSSWPVLVHCSNGVGATGTFIAVYVLMDTIKKNKDVNIFDFVKNMRDDRVDMVQTRIQYLFIFECLLAVLQSTDSQISCDQLKKLDHGAIKLKSKKEYKVLQESVIEEQHCEDYIGNSPENQHKNRFKNLIPVDRFRPVLKSQGNMFGSNSYINAYHLVDFGGREFIITQTPLTATVEDFWRLVYEYECTTIVMLNTIGGSDETVVQYWPGGAHGSAQYGFLTVECMTTTKRDSCIQSLFQVAHKKVGEKSISVDHFAFCGWSRNHPDVSKLQQFIRYTGNKNTGPVLVHCINGVGLSAVYVIVKTEGEKLEQEGSADVFQCLTKLRKICPHAIQTKEEYSLCYQLLKDHLDNPEEYAVVY